MNRLPSSQRYRRHVDRWKRYEKPQPGHRVQIDVKFVAPLKGSRRKHYQFTAPRWYECGCRPRGGR